MVVRLVKRGPCDHRVVSSESEIIPSELKLPSIAPTDHRGCLRPLLLTARILAELEKSTFALAFASRWTRTHHLVGQPSLWAGYDSFSRSHLVVIRDKLRLFISSSFVWSAWSLESKVLSHRHNRSFTQRLGLIKASARPPGSPPSSHHPLKPYIIDFCHGYQEIQKT